MPEIGAELKKKTKNLTNLRDKQIFQLKAAPTLETSLEFDAIFGDCRGRKRRSKPKDGRQKGIRCRENGCGPQDQERGRVFQLVLYLS